MSVPPESVIPPPPPGEPSAARADRSRLPSRGAPVGDVRASVRAGRRRCSPAPSPALGCFIGPLVIWLIKKDTMPFVDDQAKEALNFNITVAIAAWRCCC